MWNLLSFVMILAIVKIVTWSVEIFRPNLYTLQAVDHSLDVVVIRFILKRSWLRYSSLMKLDFLGIHVIYEGEVSCVFNIPLMSCCPSAVLSFTSSYLSLSLHEL